MSFADCVDRAVNDEDIKADAGLAGRAKEMWSELSDRYEKQGHQRHIAEALAAEDVKAAFKKEAGEMRHVYLARITNMRKLQQRAASATKDDIVWAQTKSVEAIDYEQRALVRRFNGQLGQFLKDHHADLLGRNKNPMQLENFVREMHGEKTGDTRAAALAEGASSALEDMRLSYNENGGLIGKLDNWGLPHSHNKKVITKAGFDQWFSDIKDRLDWTKIESRSTGQPFQKGTHRPDIEDQRRFLKEVYDGIVFGKDSAEAIYGKQGGVAMYRQRSDHRVLHFKTADDWMNYGKAYGNGTPFSSLMGHVQGMARDIAQMRAFGPNPRLGVEYQKQLFDMKAREFDDPKLSWWVSGNGNHANRMLRALSGPGAPSGPIAEYTATFLSSTRQFLTSAILDRAMLSSVTDFGSMRLAARAIGGNPNNVVSAYVKSITDMVKERTLATDDLLRHQWVMDSMADGGAALARFQQEHAPSAIAETVAATSMKVQGLAQHTDAARFAFQSDIWGRMAKDAGRAFDSIDPNLRALLEESGVTASDWAKFADPEFLYEAGNKATFLNPMYWREATDLPAREADEIFLKVQGAIEAWTERAVPTGSLFMRGIFEPSALGLTPGSPMYEILKSALMFKSFTMAQSINQFRMVKHAGGFTSRGGVEYMLQSAATLTIMGAMAQQIHQIVRGNDPLPMDRPEFWAQAATRGGGFAIVGDIIATGQTSWAGGFASYVAGPIPQLIDETWQLTIANAIELANGEDTNFAKELSTYGKRFTPMGQTPVLGPAIDRLFWDQLQLALDPESRIAMDRKAQRRENRDGNGSWWAPGSVTPSRAPSLSEVFGD